MLDECRDASCQLLAHPLLARGIQSTSQEQRSSIVVHAVSVGSIWHGMNSMLEQTRVIAHRTKMHQAHLRRHRADGRGDPSSWRLGAVVAGGGCECGEVVFGSPLPSHRSAV